MKEYIKVEIEGNKKIFPADASIKEVKDWVEDLGCWFDEATFEDVEIDLDSLFNLDLESLVKDMKAKVEKHREDKGVWIDLSVGCLVIETFKKVKELYELLSGEDNKENDKKIIDLSVDVANLAMMVNGNTKRLIQERENKHGR